MHRLDTFFFRSFLFTLVSYIERINFNLALLLQLLAALSTQHDKFRTEEHTEYNRFDAAKLSIAVVAGTLGQHHTTLLGQLFDPIEVFQALKFVCDGDMGVFNVESVSAMEQNTVHFILLVDNLHDLLSINQPFGDRYILVIIV